jgi:hypothetical protein
LACTYRSGRADAEKYPRVESQSASQVDDRQYRRIGDSAKHQIELRNGHAQERGEFFVGHAGLAVSRRNRPGQDGVHFVGGKVAAGA